MGTTRSIIEQRVFREVAKGASEEQAGFTFADIRALMLRGCAALASQAVNTQGEARQYLTKTYTIAASSGLFPLTAAPEADLLVESLPRATIIHSNSEWPLQFLPSISMLYLPQPGLDFIYYALGDRSLRTRDQNGQIDALTGNLVISDAVFTPTVTDDPNTTTLPDALDEDLIMWLKDAIKDKLRMDRGGA